MVFLLSIFIFLLVSMIPGDPVYAMLGEEVSPEEYNRVFHELKLDQPVIVRYFSWLADALHGDLGESTQFHMKYSQQEYQLHCFSPLRHLLSVFHLESFLE